jgi:hypothetical protein
VWIALSEAADEVTRPVGRRVVDHDQLPAAAERVEGLREASMELGQAVELVVAWHHHRDLGTELVSLV